MTRRNKGEDTIVMFTMNSREAERRDGTGLACETAKYGIIHLDGFDTKIGKLAGHVDFLADAAPRLEVNVATLRDAIATHRSRTDVPAAPSPQSEAYRSLPKSTSISARAGEHG